MAPHPVPLAVGLAALPQSLSLIGRELHVYQKRAYVGTIVGPIISIFVVCVIFYFSWVAYHQRREEQRKLAATTALVAVAASAAHNAPTTTNIYTTAPGPAPAQQHGMAPMPVQATGQYPPAQYQHSPYQQPHGSPYPSGQYAPQGGHPSGMMPQPQPIYVTDQPPKYGA